MQHHYTMKMANIALSQKMTLMLYRKNPGVYQSNFRIFQVLSVIVHIQNI